MRWQINLLAGHLQFLMLLAGEVLRTQPVKLQKTQAILFISKKTRILTMKLWLDVTSTSSVAFLINEI